MNNNTGDVRPLWGDSSIGGCSVLTSSHTPTIGEMIDVGGLKAQVCNVFINEGRMYVSYKLGGEIFTKEYNTGVILG